MREVKPALIDRLYNAFDEWDYNQEGVRDQNEEDYGYQQQQEFNQKKRSDGKSPNRKKDPGAEDPKKLGSKRKSSPGLRKSLE